MKKKNKFKKYFIIISIVFLIGLLFAYTTRLIHFYMKENVKKNENGEVVSNNYFSDILENTINVSDINGGLYLDGESYMYKYAATENYLWYSGHLWRLISINEDKTITMIADESIALLIPEYDENNYLNDFLEEFYNKLDQELLVKHKYCSDKVDDLKALTCDNKEEKSITSLDLYTYNKIGGQKSFITNKTIFWLANQDGNNDYWYIDEIGAAGKGTENIAHNVRPMITIKDKIELVSGNGTYEDPYVVKESNNKVLSSAVTGEYIKFNEELWRILDINENSISALKLECIKNEEECLKYKFGSNITYLNSTIYKYLNETYYNNLENKDYLVKDKFYIGNYIDYNFKTLKDNSIEAYIGLPKISEYYTQNYFDSYLITPNTFETIYTINENGNYYLVKPTNEKNIYPVINLDKNLNISTGKGTINEPYELSR